MLIMDLQLKIVVAALLVSTRGINSQLPSESEQVIHRNHTCDFESVSNCGWIVDTPTAGQGTTAISTASNRPAAGPSTDANPGNQNGNYFYFNSSTLTETVRILHFPHYSQICGLSFSYHVSGPLELGILLENFMYYTVYMTQSPDMNGPDVWMRESFSFNSSEPFDGLLHFEVSPFEVGEADVEPGGSDVFLGIDNISLMFCLPCDFDRLNSEEGFVFDGPNEFTIRLRVTSQIAFNATSPVCPNEPLLYTIDSVEPAQVASIFSVDSSKGVLRIQAQGEGLVPKGIQDGSLRISVQIPGSNYENIFPPVNNSLLVTFHQPPTITHTAPPTLSVQVGTTFSYHFTTASELGRSLNFGTIATNPTELADDVSVTEIGNEVTVMGTLSVSRDLPAVLENNTTPSITIPIIDDISGVVEATTMLVIEQSAPVFSQSQYTFDVPEGISSMQPIGPIPVTDSNGDAISIPMIPDSPDSKIFRPFAGEPSGIFTNIYLLPDYALDYEIISQYEFTMIVYDEVNASLSSQATVVVNVVPVNEFAPMFVESDHSVMISDNSPVGAIVSEFIATDNDGGADGDITYSITSGNTDGFFQINPPSFGEVTVKRSPIHPQEYTLTITATDGGNPPLSAHLMLTVTVIATTDIDCTNSLFRPPTISSQPNPINAAVNSNVTMDCVYTGNPVVTVYKWDHVIDGITILESTEHYTLNRHSLVVDDLTVEDAGVYVCNVTNQCGSATLSHLITVIDYPGPPLNLQVVSGPDLDSFILTWDPPDTTIGLVTRPVDSYEVRVRRDESEDYQTVSTVNNTVNVIGLHPGTTYLVTVASINSAGESLSDVINITTLPAVPKLSYLRAMEQFNHSLLIEWDLRYSGGSPIVSFEIHIILQADRTKRASPDLIYHVDVDAGQLMTRSLQSGHTYTVMGRLYNSLGSSNEFSNIYIGQKDFLICDFEDTGCYWQPEEGSVTTATDAPSPLLNTDSSGSPQGHYVSAISSSQQEVVIMSYSKAWYGCGYSFSYQLSSNGRLSLRTTSGREIWSRTGSTGGWVQEAMDGEQFLTNSQEEGLQFLLQGDETAAGLDDVHMKFCLPCDFDLLRNNSRFVLTYDTNIKLFLRTEQTLTLSADLFDCSNAHLNFAATRVIPGEIESRFSLSQEIPHTLSISVSAIPSDTVLPHTAGFIEIAASVVYSDYRPDNSLIERTAFIEFILVAASENCSFPESCGFEASDTGCDSWDVGSGVQRIDAGNSPVQQLQSNRGTFLYGDYTSTTVPSSIVTSTRIGDAFCAIAFSYSAPPTSELVLSVEGLGQIWTSLLATTGTQWTSELIPFDLESAVLSSERRLEFFAGQSEGFRNGLIDTTLPVYVALDGITLHPCIDCNTPECVFTSCTPGRYFSLNEENCIACPPGYYCPDWRSLPIPCPPGTYSQTLNAASLSVCMPCPSSTYSLSSGSVSCEACPSGHSCVNSSHYPISDDQCPVSTPGTSPPQADSMLTVIVGAAAGGVALCLCLLLSCVIGCWCYCSRKKRIKPGNKGRKGRLLGEDVLTIGSAGSLGRSSVGSFDSRGRRWTKGKDVSTLMSFLSEDERNQQETSWENAEQFTEQPDRNEQNQISVGFMNDAYDYEGEDGMQLVDLGNYNSHQSSTKPANMSQF